MRVKVTEKPGWPYVLVNDFTQPPYFAYEVVDAEGNKSFVRVLKGGSEGLSHKPTHPESIMFTNHQKEKVLQMLKKTLKTPLTYGEFMGTEWMEQLVKRVGMFHDHSMQVASQILERWLSCSCFEKLIEQIRTNQKDAQEKARVKLAKEKAKEASSSEKPVEKRRAPEKDETSDDSSSDSDESLFTPIKVVRKKNSAKGS